MVANAFRSAALAGGCAVVVFACAIACSKSGSSDDRTNTDNPDASKDPEPLFRALQDDLVKACGGANGQCHVLGTYQSAPRWLAGPDPYLSAKKYRGIVPITHEPDDSIVLSQVRHEGPALADIKAADGQRTLFDRVAEWITAEAPPPPLPNTGGFSVRAGFNLVHLDTVASGLSGATLTFLATDQNQVLDMTALKLNAPPNANVHVTSPFFVIMPRSGKVNADPDVNGFKGELTVKAGQSADLFLGKMILLRWDSNGQLKIVFTAIDSTPGTAANTDCTALDQFKGSALTALQGQVDIIDPGDPDGGSGGGDAGAIIGKGSCIGCHGDKAGTPAYPTAVNAMDLREWDTAPDKACISARAWINFDNPGQSTILLNPQGLVNPTHPMKSIGASDPIITGLSTWVLAEKK
jgi:hypothetical protein